jgi:hypothetical protein
MKDKILYNTLHTDAYTYYMCSDNLVTFLYLKPVVHKFMECRINGHCI